MFFILQSICAFKYKKDPLHSSISTTFWGGKKKKFGSDSAIISRIAESFLPTCPFWKNFFSFYCDFNELPHMPSFCPAPTAQIHMEGPGWAAQAMSMHSFALFTSSSSDKLAAFTGPEYLSSSVNLQKHHWCRRKEPWWRQRPRAERALLAAFVPPALVKQRRWQHQQFAGESCDLVCCLKAHSWNQMINWDSWLLLKNNPFLAQERKWKCL